MELRQAQAFVAVADHGGFAAAAAELETVQPAVTRLIARLERANDIVLFERTPRRVTITAAGERLLPAARALLAAHERVEAELAEVRDGRAGLLRIGTTVGMTGQATAIAAAFAAEHPGVELRLSSARTPKKLQRLRTGELDLAFVRDADAMDTAGLRLATLWDDALLAAAPVARIDPMSEAARLGDLADLPLMSSPRDSNPGVRAKVDVILSRAGISPPDGPPITATAEALAIIAAGRAWSILLPATISGIPQGVALRPIDDPAAVSRVQLAWRPGAEVPHRSTFIETTLSLRDRGLLSLG